MTCTAVLETGGIHLFFLAWVKTSSATDVREGIVPEISNWKGEGTTVVDLEISTGSRLSVDVTTLGRSVRYPTNAVFQGFPE